MVPCIRLKYIISREFSGRTSLYRPDKPFNARKTPAREHRKRPPRWVFGWGLRRKGLGCGTAVAGLRTFFNCLDDIQDGLFAVGKVHQRIVRCKKRVGDAGKAGA
jgi:hypothetical protein